MFHYSRSILIFLAISFFSLKTATAQTFPGLSSCTSKDLELISVTLPAPANDLCSCTGARKLVLGIRNKTGSTRTSFAFWGTLIRRNANGDPINASGVLIPAGQPIGVKIFACASDIKKSSDNFLPTTYGTTDIAIACNQSLEIVDLYLAWTSASPGETCDVLFNNPSTINPKCGTLPFIPIGVGVDAAFAITNATCSTGGSITVSPSGGKAPYLISIDGSLFTTLTSYSNLVAGSHTFIIKDVNGCSTTKTRTVGASSAPIVSAGAPFTKTCTLNPDGIAIGETNDPLATYLWNPTSGLTSSTASNPTANPTSTTTYTVTKTTIANGCSAQASVLVTVDTVTPVAAAGNDVTINCTTPSATLGATGGVSYSWSPAMGLSATNSANPTATPAITTTYTVTVTGANGCTKTDDVIVTVDKALPLANAGNDVTINCTTASATLGATGGVSYSWSPATGLSATNSANPSATPAVTTTYTVTVTGANGCTKTDDVIVTVDKALPLANAGNDVTINCTTASATLAATGGVSYSWSPATGLSATNSANPTATPAATTTYTVTVTGANGCTKTDDVIVTVDKALPLTPTVCIVQPSLCSTDRGSVTINSPCGADYEYSIKNGGAGTWQSAIHFDNLNPGDVTGIRVRNKNTGCVSNAASCDVSDCSISPCPVPLAKIANPTTKTTSEIIPIETTLTVKTTTAGFEVYPVPFKDRLTIKYNFDYVSDVKIEVFNAQGISILSKRDTNSYLNKEIALDLKLNKGKEQMYIVKVTTDRESIVKKVMSSR
ncbi:T9SS type A sorting domain-containing protein [Flavobacterium sp. LB3P122]|uniref:T9SS type A sorting domain-containing protein n=1 Tax=Flavobacterium algoriphilum TaxID=3398738 RepID=UPI003A871A49